MLSELQKIRLKYKPQIPLSLTPIELITIKEQLDNKEIDSEVAAYFPHTQNQKIITFKACKEKQAWPLRVGVVFSGGQASGGHNVIAGLFDALKKQNKKSSLIGFLDGPSGIIHDKSIEITEMLLENYRNQGGFDMIGSGRTKFETVEQLEKSRVSVEKHKLDGLVIIGGDDSNTNAAFMAEYFIDKNCATRVIGVPKTIDGDLQCEHIPISFGFDTACKIYSETIGNLCQDVLSSKKYYFFIKLMGRSASHVTLECALKTHPNKVILGEEIASENKTLKNIIDSLTELICKRALLNKNYGVILIPEGLIEFIPEINRLIDELNDYLSKREIPKEGPLLTDVLNKLSTQSKELFLSLPIHIQSQLLINRDPHGNIQVSKIETESLLMNRVKDNLLKKIELGLFKGKFDPQTIFLGYEGRSALPSNFDSQYCYALGYSAAALIKSQVTGYICTIKNLTDPVENWECGGYPLTKLMQMEKRQGKMTPVVKKTVVDLKGKPYTQLKANRDSWELNDFYESPGPIQFFGDKILTDSFPLSL